MCVTKFLTGINIITFLTLTQSDHQIRRISNYNSKPLSDVVHWSLQNTDADIIASSSSSLRRIRNIQDSYVNNEQLKETRNELPNNINRRRRRDAMKNATTDDINSSSFDRDEIGWSVINEEVDMVIPLVLSHLNKLGIEHLELPDMKESITINPFFITYEAGLFLSNGIVYNLDGIKRYSNAYMTYEGKSFLTKFYLKINVLQFEYNFLIKLMAIEGYGKVIGSLEDTLIYAELAINVPDSKLNLNAFRIIKFRNIQVQLDQSRLIRQLTGVILSPITNLFKDRITTSIADGLRDQMQIIMDDFNNNDPLELRKFTKKILAGLTGQTEN